MNDDQIRALISEMRATHSKPGGNEDAYRLALIAQELMAQRDRRSEDFYRSDRAVRRLEAEAAQLNDRHAEELAAARAVADMRMREIGDLQRQLRKLHAAYAEQGTQIARNHSEGQ